MITNPTLQILSTFKKLKIPEAKSAAKSMGMMARSRPPLQEKADTKKQPMMVAKEIQMHIRNANQARKNGESDGTIV